MIFISYKRCGLGLHCTYINSSHADKISCTCMYIVHLQVCFFLRAHHHRICSYNTYISRIYVHVLPACRILWHIWYTYPAFATAEHVLQPAVEGWLLVEDLAGEDRSPTQQGRHGTQGIERQGTGTRVTSGKTGSTYMYMYMEHTVSTLRRIPGKHHIYMKNLLGLSSTINPKPKGQPSHCLFRQA